MLPYVETVSNPLPRATVARGRLSFTGINTRAARRERRQRVCVDKVDKSVRRRVCVDVILHVNQKTANVYRSCQLIAMKNVNYSKTSAIGWTSDALTSQQRYLRRIF
jgi:hypothetical protein